MTIGFVHNPHDKFFRSAMAQVAVAREFFETHLPAKVRGQLDFTTLKAEKDTFVDDAFKASEVDLLYSIKLLNYSTAYIYLLCEHQSTVDKDIAFRVLVYLTDIIKHHRKQHPGGALPVVIPMVLYTGIEPWTAPLDIFPLFGEQESLAHSLWPPSYELIDVQRLTDEELKTHNLSGLMEWVFKHAKARDFEKALSEMFSRLNQISKKDVEQALYLGKNRVLCIASISETLDKKTFNRLADQHFGTTPLRSEIMTLAEQFRQEGMQQGMQQGMQSGMKQGEAAILKMQLERRFGTLDSGYLNRLEQASSEQLLVWGGRILDADSLNKIFEH